MAFALKPAGREPGMSIGPVIGGFLAMKSFKSLFYVDGTSAIIAAALIAFMPKHSASGPGTMAADAQGT